MSRDHIGFTLDVRKFVSVIAQDPRCRAEILAGLQGTPEPLTSALGAANLAGQGQEPMWCSLFPATVQGKNAGEEGLFYRNDSQGGKGDRIQMRLKRQPQREQYTQTPAQVLPQQGQVNPQTQAILAAAQANPALLAGLLQAAAAKAQAQPQQAQAVVAAPVQHTNATPEGAQDIPPDILAVVNQGE